MKNELKRAYELKDQMVRDRRHLHRNPEIAHDLPETTAFVMNRLEELGCAPEEIAPSAVTGTIIGGKPGKTILLRADMDALPMAENSGLPFASTIDKAHTCGHDIHTAMLLTAAQILKENAKDLCGTVKLMFQPAEETLTGAESMVKAGVLENPGVDAAFAMHVAADLPVGSFGYNDSTGYMYASSDSFQIDIKGKGSHGAHPHRGIDPLNVGAHTLIALQALPAREIPPLDPIVVTVGQLSGGAATNIIPETAVLKGTIRLHAPSLREFATRRLTEIAEYTAKTFGAEASVTWLAKCPCVSCDYGMTQSMLELIKGYGFENAEFVNGRTTLGSEDFAFVVEKVPSTFLILGAADKDPARRVPYHNPNIVFDEDCMPIGAAIHAGMAMTWLEKNV